MTRRALLDTNVLISYLLRRETEGIVQTILQAFVEGRFTLLLPELLLEELVVTISNKPQLAQRIPPAELQAFVSILQTFGETVSRIRTPIPPVTRDPKDDYLLAYALVGRADYLVTGDADLLVLQAHVEEMQIVTPRQFATVLGENA